MKRQTQYKNETIARYGCYFCCMLRIAELMTKKELTEDEVIALAEKARQTKSWDGENPVMGENCYLYDPATVTNIALEHLGARRKLEQVAIMRDNEVHRWGEFAFTKGTEWDFTVFDWATKNGSHFTLMDYDPDPKCERGLGRKLVFYKIRGCK